MSISDVIVNTDSRAFAVTSVLILMSVFLGIPSLVPVLRWIVSTIRLRWLLRSGGGNANDDDDDDGDGSGFAVSGLFVHPVKSMRAVSLSESTLDRKGLSSDRRFMVVYELPLPQHKTEWREGDTTHRFLTQRQCPSLATVSATIESANRALVLERKVSPSKVGGSGETGSATIRVPLSLSLLPARKEEPPKKTFLAGIWDDVVAVDDMGDAAAAFLQAVADADDELAACGGKRIVRLVRESETTKQPPAGIDHREYVPDYAKAWNGGPLGKPTLTDGFPILIASEASLDALNEKLVAGGNEAIPMSRFRPNIVVRGKSLKPFEEDRWKVVAIGSVVFAIVKACPRCKQSCTDQTTGEVSPKMEPVETMKSFRRSSGDAPRNGSVFFAQNAIPIGTLDGKTIKVGDPVRVLERGDPVYID